MGPIKGINLDRVNYFNLEEYIGIYVKILYTMLKVLLMNLKNILNF